jgi:hypothetical protein
MESRTLASAAAAGIAAFLVTVVAVTELLLPTVEFSVLVGLPAGIAVGFAVAAAVLLRSGEESSRLGRSLAAFVVVFLAVLAVGVVLAGPRTSILAGSVAGVALGIVAGIAMFLLSGSRS